MLENLLSEKVKYQTGTLTTEGKNEPSKVMVVTNELLCLKKAGAQISIFFTSNE
jgi:hypothetical protein